MGDALNPMKLIGDAMHALQDVGKTLEDVGKGDFNALGKDIQNDFGDAMKLGSDYLSMTQPELAPFLQGAQQFMGMANQGGQFDPSQAVGNPPPFSQGGIPGQAFNDPWGYGGGYGGPGGYAGGGGGVGGPGGGYGGPGGGVAGAGGQGSFYGGGMESQLDANLQKAYASGDQAAIYKAQQAKQKYDDYWQGLQKLAEIEHKNKQQAMQNWS